MKHLLFIILGVFLVSCTSRERPAPTAPKPTVSTSQASVVNAYTTPRLASTCPSAREVTVCCPECPVCPVCPICQDPGTYPDSSIPPTGCTIFPASSPWNTDISSYPVHWNSAKFIAYIGATTPLHPDFGENNTGIPFMYRPADQGPVPITFFDYADESDPGPYPVPFNAPVENGEDKHVSVVDLIGCKLYEMYNASVVTNSAGTPTGWRASCGAVFDLTTDNLRPIGWTAADAAGLPMFPGLVRHEEIQAGEIKHALRFTVARTQKAFVLPATHYASTITNVNASPMGLRLRLKASRDISMFSPSNQVILRALKKYGMFVADNGGNMFLSGAPSPNWVDDDLFRMKFGSNWTGTDAIRASDFEVVNTGPIRTTY